MTRQEHLLVILAEECAEVAHRCSKALRFGLDDVAPGQALTSGEQIRKELMHLLVVAGYLNDEGLDLSHDQDVSNAKIDAVELWLEHSRRQGTLTV